MKRIAIISLLAVFIITNYAYATSPIDELAQQVEQKCYQEITQEEIEEVFNIVMNSVDWEALQQDDDLTDYDLECVRHQMVVDKYDKKLRDTYKNLRSFIYHFLHKSQSTILCPS